MIAIKTVRRESKFFYSDAMYIHSIAIAVEIKHDMEKYQCA